MRTDRGLPAEVRASHDLDVGEWGQASAPLSGSERDRLFRNDGTSFTDVSTLSGLDSVDDGKSFATLDYDRDGAIDVAVVNSNKPWLQLFHNDAAVGRAMVAVRLIGGNHTARASSDWSARDAYGARIEVTAGGRELVREHHCGEGLAAQNSATQIVGIGSSAEATSVVVKWPSGKVTTLGRVRAGSLVTIYENPADSPSSTAMVLSKYGDPSDARPNKERAGQFVASARLDLPPSRAPLRVVSTVATWCEACAREAPQIRRLQQALPSAEVEFLAVPVDPADTKEMLVAFVARIGASYRLLADVDPDTRKRVQQLVIAHLYRDLVPATIVIDSAGSVMAVLAGAPTISDIRSLVHASKQRAKRAPQKR